MDTEIQKVLGDKRSPVVTIAPEAIVLDAVALMNERNIGSVLVLGGGTPVGIFTERDVLTRVVAARRDPATTTVGEVMTRALVTIAASTTVQAAMALMTDRRCRHLPVTVEDRIVGMISIGDLTRWVVRDQQRTIVDLTDFIHHAS